MADANSMTSLRNREVQRQSMEALGRLEKVAKFRSGDLVEFKSESGTVKLVVQRTGVAEYADRSLRWVDRDQVAWILRSSDEEVRKEVRYHCTLAINGATVSVTPCFREDSLRRVVFQV